MDGRGGRPEQAVCAAGPESSAARRSHGEPKTLPCLKTEIPPCGTDPYSRPGEKRGGAWMGPLIGQSRLFAAAGQKVRLPICNMVRPHCAARRLVAPKLMSVLHGHLWRMAVLPGMLLSAATAAVAAAAFVGP